METVTRLEETLFPLFVPPTGPAMMLITHYYVTGKPQSDPTFLQDPLDQARWCRDHLPYFSAVAKRLAVMRNTLAHAGVVTPMMLKKTSEALDDS